MQTKVRASDAIKRPPIPKLRLNGSGPPIRASELVKRRHAQALADMQRAIERREVLFLKLAKEHNRIVALGRQVRRYETL